MANKYAIADATTGTWVDSGDDEDLTGSGTPVLEVVDGISCATFVGGKQYTNSAIPFPATGGTLLAIAKVASDTPSYSVIAGCRNDANSRIFQLYCLGGSVGYNYNDNYDFTGATAPSTKFCLYAVTIVGTTAKLYRIDDTGTTVTTDTRSQSHRSAVDAPFWIANDNNPGIFSNTARAFKGSIARVEFHADVVLTQAQLEAIYSSVIPTTTTRTQPGVASIAIRTTRTQPGVASIASANTTATKTQAGLSRIQKQVTATQPGVSRIQAQITATQTGVGRVQKQVTATQTGVSAIVVTTTTTRTQAGVARIYAQISATQAGVSRIYKQIATTQAGVAAIIVAGSTTRSQNGVARILRQPEFSREAAAALPAGITNLSTPYSAQDYIDVNADDAVRVGMKGTNYLIHQFTQSAESVSTGIEATCNVQAAYSPQISPVRLQIYNHVTSLWETIAENNTSPPGTDFTLYGIVSGDTAPYYSGMLTVSFRVYQYGGPV
jgi:hypothetical protein